MNELLPPPFLQSLPSYLQVMVLRPPSAGSGLHQWIFKVSLKLHDHLSAREIYRLLRHVTSNCDRFVPQREIVDAINNSVAISKSRSDLQTLPLTHGDRLTTPVWPPVDPDLQRQSARKYETWEQIRKFLSSSPGLPSQAAEFYIPALMGESLLCCGEKTSVFETKPTSEWKGKLNEQQFIVPSPMSAVYGRTRDGVRLSMHTLSNTGKRRFIVVEFDSGSNFHQLALHQHLATKAPLALVVFSGGKSFHGWYFCEGMPEDRVRAFFEYAVRLGADSRTWSPAQFVRMPGGTRQNSDGTTTDQGVLYFNPNACTKPTPYN